METPGAITQYDRMRREVLLCASVDEAADLSDKAEALRFYARQQHDTELEAAMDDIKVRAVAKLGELSAALPQAAHGGEGGGTKVRGGGLSKEAVLRSAGISKQRAHEAEQVAKVVEYWPPNVRLRMADVKVEVKKVRRAARESYLAEAAVGLSEALGTKLYGVIYADPPWRFAYRSEAGMGRAADNHYPTMDHLQIAMMEVPAAPDCVLFLWATVPTLPEAFTVMAGWGFDYRSHFVWVKDRPGTGFWNRNQHELLLVGAKGAIPAPAPGEQYPSVIKAPVQAHSVKPPHFAEMIEDMFPNAALLEMFARGPRLGWDVWGNEA